MPYREHIFFKDGHYHIYNRGSEKRIIFLDRADKERFLVRAQEYRDKYAVTILCYCLMPNHYHLLVRQDSDEPASKFISRLNLSYAMYFNKRYERVGPLFQNRFKAKLVEKDDYIVHLSRYIHLNPLVEQNYDVIYSYPWSSLKSYLSGKKGDIVDPSIILSYFGDRSPTLEYKKFIDAEADKKMILRIEDLLFEEISPIQARGLKRSDE